MRTKVRFNCDDKSSTPPYYQKGDYGMVDGYVANQYGQSFACVIVNKSLTAAPLHHLEVLDDNTTIPIPDSNKFPTEKEINDMAGKYDLGPNYNMEPGFYAAISWVKEWMSKRNLL